VVDLSSSGFRRLEFDATIEPKAGMIVELPAVAPIVIQLGNLPLKAGEAYTWSVAVDGESNPDWSVNFTTNSRANEFTVNTI
jgi:hypothetical protein